MLDAIFSGYGSGHISQIPYSGANYYHLRTQTHTCQTLGYYTYNELTDNYTFLNK